MLRIFIFSILFIISCFTVKAQTQIDGIIAWIGKDIILQSDLEKAYADYLAEMMIKDGSAKEKCMVFERLVYNKLLLHQADVDSVVITEQQVEAAINYRMNYFLQQVGGDARRLENHFGKSISEIKKLLREIVREQMYIEDVQERLTANIAITPAEVKAYVERVGVDSMPLIPANFEIGHIIKTPPVSEAQIIEMKARLENYRNRVLTGESKFETLARLYSDDPGSASRGGRLGFVERGTLFPEFEAVAFNLKSGEISQVVKSKAGYHIIQLHERRGESIDVSHILLQPKPSAEEQVKAIEFLDSIRQVIMDKRLDFSEAALQFSDDPNKMSDGWVVHPYSLSTKFSQEDFDQATFATINKLYPGAYSTPVIFINEDGVTSYRLIYLKSKIAPHRANLVEDYDFIKTEALAEKKFKALEKWFIKKVETTSIKICSDYQQCEFISRWQIK
jgi:peptidyl-prolyl cis-trans isomerase SurA